MKIRLLLFHFYELFLLSFFKFDDLYTSLDLLNFYYLDELFFFVSVTKKRPLVTSFLYLSYLIYVK